MTANFDQQVNFEADFGSAPQFESVNKAPPPPLDANIVFDTTPKVEPTQPKNYRFWEIGYYQPLFDVDTSDVLKRMLKTLWPFGTNFFEFVNPTPDLYGPFWIATTIIFLLAATSNFASWVYLAFRGHSEEWAYDFSKMTFGAGVLYPYIAIVPAIVWGTCKWMGVPLRLLEHLCVYGYSLFVYIPASLLMIVPWKPINWVIMAITAFFSIFFLLRNYYSPLKVALKRGILLMLAMAAGHFGLALLFTLEIYEFNYTDPVQ